MYHLRRLPATPTTMKSDGGKRNIRTLVIITYTRPRFQETECPCNSQHQPRSRIACRYSLRIGDTSASAFRVDLVPRYGGKPPAVHGYDAVSRKAANSAEVLYRPLSLGGNSLALTEHEAKIIVQYRQHKIARTEMGTGRPSLQRALRARRVALETSKFKKYDMYR